MAIQLAMFYYYILDLVLENPCMAKEEIYTISINFRIEYEKAN